MAPDAIEGIYAANAYFDSCSIPRTLRRLAELRVLQMNGCTYCTWLHSRQGALGEGENRIAAIADWRSANCFSGPERAALQWTELVTRISAGAPSDAAFADMRHCFDERQIVDLAAIVSNMNALNRMAISFRREAPD